MTINPDLKALDDVSYSFLRVCFLQQCSEVLVDYLLNVGASL